MKKFGSVEEYIENNPKFSSALTKIRKIILSTDLEESLKWNAPVYSFDGKNVLGLGAFKNHFGIWFFNGVFLKDEQNALQNVQEGKTKALRQMRFETIDDVNLNIVKSYVNEAIDNQRSGKAVVPTKTTKKDIEITGELVAVFKGNKQIKKAFDNLSPYKQKEYAEYISSAKRDATKQSRLEKIKPMIVQGVGLNDKYKDC